MGFCFSVLLVVFIVGIFLGGQIYIGLENFKGGCVGDLFLIVFVECLCELLFCVDCLKIGMFLCIDVCIVDFSKM